MKENIENFKILGGTQGYTSPKYFSNQKVNAEIAKKKDYFALDASLFYLYYKNLKNMKIKK
jgi:hypothetical protein